jgi:ABC-2 type transport system ATP-binding protein
MCEVETLADRVAIIRQGVIVEEAQPSKLAGMSLRRMRLRFREPVDAQRLATVPGVKVLSPNDGVHVTLQVEGEIDALIQALAALPVVDLETEHPSLEEVFLAYYEDAGKEAT